MLNKTLLGIAAFAIFMVIPAVAAASTGCNKIKFTGSYVRTAPTGTLPDGTSHSTIYQLNLNTDGTAVQNWTGFLDYAINTGAGSPYYGSWTCRADGKLIVTLITAGYGVVPAGSYPGVTAQDISLAFHTRTTALYSVDDGNTLTRLAFRSRSYGPTDDATNPTGGMLGTLFTNTVVFNRLVATDDDLLAP